VNTNRVAAFSPSTDEATEQRGECFRGGSDDAHLDTDPTQSGATVSQGLDVLLKATTVTMLFPKTCGHYDASASACVICGGLYWAVAVSAAVPVGSVSTRRSNDGYRVPVSCIPTPDVRFDAIHPR
jgi:hypothetical protein